MNILSLDVGTYSIKMLKAVIERRQPYIIDSQEVIIADASKDLHPTMPLSEKQTEIVKSLLEGEDESKVILQFPNQLLTSRYLDFPTNNEKQVSLMIPFQLEEKLPFSSQEIHYSSFLNKKKDDIKATVAVTQKKDFDDYYELIVRKEILPTLLTSELGVIQCYLYSNFISGDHAILDLGHTASKVYFVHNGTIVSNHVCRIAGQTIDEVISKFYSIDLEEVSTYKHQNCFFLTEEQYQNVSKEQQDFAKLMKQTFFPLIQDFKLWELGHRVSYGQIIKNIYLMGGTSRIRNLPNFLTQHFNIPVDYFPFPSFLLDQEEKLDGIPESYSLSSLMLDVQKEKTRLPSFLHGKYSGKTDQGIPLHSASFILVRTSILAAVLIVFFMIERFVFILPELSKKDRLNRKLIKDPILELSARVRREYRKRPERIVKTLAKKLKITEDSIKVIQSSAYINSLSSLSLLSELVSDHKHKKISLIHFKNIDDQSTAVFESEDIILLGKFAEKLKTLELKDKKIKYKQKDTRLTFTFQEDY